MSPPTNIILKNRFLSFLIWQSIQSTSIFILTKTFLLSPFTSTPFIPSFLSLISLLFFLLSMLIFSIFLQSIASPHWHPPASPFELVLGLLRLVLTGSPPPGGDFVRRARVSLTILLVVIGLAVSGFVGVVSIGGITVSGSFSGLIGKLGIKGFGMGLVYGLYCLFNQRWVLVFPIVQRPAFFSYKMGLLSSVRQALKLSVVSSLFLISFSVLLVDSYKSHVAGGYMAEHFIFYVVSFAVILSWELILHLHKVLHTKRCVFALSKGSAAVEGNPSEPLIAALEESDHRSLLQYLAYLDLNMVCVSNVDAWRRAAFFEETGGTYKRVMAVCLKPLEQFASKLAEGLTSSTENTHKLSIQLCSPDDISRRSEILESFSDFQLYGWCAQAVASLVVRSHKEDRFGVAQLSGSHATALSTLLSSLVAVETCMGKKINLQSPNHILGPTGIKWATNSTARTEIVTAMNKKRGTPSHTQSYALADVLKASIYSIVSEFHEEMLACAKLGALEKDWVNTGNPVYGSTDLLTQKLHYFLNFQAS